MPDEFTLETAFGSVPPIGRPEDFKQIEREAREEHVERTVRKIQAADSGASSSILAGYGAVPPHPLI
jgi:hypothetical protein